MNTIQIISLSVTGFNLFVLFPLLIFTYRLYKKTMTKHRLQLDHLQSSVEIFQEAFYPPKVYLVWLTGGDDLRGNKNISALVGCLRTKEEAEKYLNGKEGIVQEVHVQGLPPLTKFTLGE